MARMQEMAHIAHVFKKKIPLPLSMIRLGENYSYLFHFIHSSCDFTFRQGKKSTIVGVAGFMQPLFTYRLNWARKTS